MLDGGYLDRLRAELVAAAGRGRRRPPAAVLAAGAAAVVLIGIGLVAWLGPDGGDEAPVAVTTSSAVTTTTVTTSAPPTTVPVVPVGTIPWARVPDLDGVFVGAAVSAIAPFAGGWVAAGSMQGGDESAGAMWQSSDGVTWERVAPPEEAATAFVHDVLAVDSRLYAAGTAQLGAAVWVSDAGGPWQRALDGTGPPEAAFASVNAIVATPSGMVAVGQVAETQKAEPARVGVWTAAADGVWQRRDDPTFGDGVGSWALNDVAAAGGTIVAVGVADSLAATSDPVAWYSDDGGQTWGVAEVETGSEFEGFAGMAGVAAGGPGFVAVGFEQDIENAAAVWTSVDGRRWDRVPGDPDLFGGDVNHFVRMSAVTAAPGRLVAVGNERRGLVFNAAAWESRDGSDWVKVGLGTASDGFVFDVAAVGDTIVAVGAELGNGRMWISPVPADLPEPIPGTTTTTTEPEPQAAPDSALSVSLFPDTISERAPVSAFITGVRDLAAEDGFILVWLFDEATGAPVDRVCRPPVDVFGNQVQCTFQPGTAVEPLPPGRYVLGVGAPDADPQSDVFTFIPRDVLIVTEG